MASPDPWQRRLGDLQLDLRIEQDKLSQLVASLQQLKGRIEAGKGTGETVDSAALRLQSLYTGVERCLLLIERVLNGARPAVLSHAVRAALAELLAFRHVVRHLYAYELDDDRVRLLLQRATALWPAIEADLDRFQAWLEELRLDDPGGGI